MEISAFEIALRISVTAAGMAGIAVSF